MAVPLCTGGLSGAVHRGVIGLAEHVAIHLPSLEEWLTHSLPCAIPKPKNGPRIYSDNMPARDLTNGEEAMPAVQNLGCMQRMQSTACSPCGSPGIHIGYSSLPPIPSLIGA